MTETADRICQNCKQNFHIEPDDFAFYERIRVPPPTWCLKCRQRRRYAWRNEKVFYRRNCDLCGKSMVTIYSSDKPFKVFCPVCWWSDKWSALDFGKEFDFTRPFFPQWQELQLQIPRIALLTKNSVNSEYTNHSNNNKNCYLCASTFDSENVLYSTNVYDGARDTSDCYHITLGNELLYECIDSEHCYNCQYGILLRNCNNCFYSFDCRGCSNCFLSANLRNKQYYFLNKPYSKEDYLKELSRFELGSFAERQKLLVEFSKIIAAHALHRFAIIEKSVRVSGNMIVNSKEAENVFDMDDVENLKNSTLAAHIKDSRDIYHCGFSSELIYEGHGIIHSARLFFTHLSYDNHDLMYCDSCHNSEHLFGCVGIKHGKFAILNKVHEEGEYNKLKEKIIAHMRETGEFGEFFPPALSPFGYNETQGQVYMPLSKEEALAQGFKWQEQMPGTYAKETIGPDAISDNVQDITDSITQEVLACMNCKRNYNIVKPELDLYRKMNIPIPRFCPDCRYLRRIKLRGPRALWPRNCMCDNKVHRNISEHFHGQNRCPNTFETSYAPGRPEIIYCESCYQAEVA